MIRIYGKATVSTWRPMENGGVSQMRTAQRESDDVTVLNNLVILQHHDGFWETFPLANCSIIWQGKPEVTLLTEEDRETLLPISGRDHTMADELVAHGLIRRQSTTPMRTHE
jgi:hypothetical protein